MPGVPVTTPCGPPRSGVGRRFRSGRPPPFTGGGGPGLRSPAYAVAFGPLYQGLRPRPRRGSCPPDVRGGGGRFADGRVGGPGAPPPPRRPNSCNQNRLGSSGQS